MCLLRFVTRLDRTRFCPIVVLYDDNIIARELRASGVEVHVVLPSFPVDLLAAVRRRAPALSSVAAVLRPLQQMYNFVLHFVRPAILHTMALKRWRVDILHLNNSINTNHEWILAGRLADVAVISHQRGISDDPTRAAIRFGRSLDGVICISEATMRPLVRYGFDRSRLHLVYDGVEESAIRVTQPAEAIRSLWDIPPRAPIIGVVGNIKRWKGQETVIRAVAHMQTQWPDLRCLLVGSVADPDYKESLDALIHSLGLSGRVVFVGFQWHPADYINVMDVVVHSSVEAEPFGMVNLEAMWIRKPVVSTTIGGPAEIFRHGIDGMLVEPGDALALSGALDSLLRDGGLRRRMGDAAHATVGDRFRLDETVRSIERIYETV